MRAVVCQHAGLEVAELPDPVPAPGQIVLDVLRCGICGSDLHARRHCDELAAVMDEAGYADFMRSVQPVVLGHEFVGEIAGYGPGSRRKLRTGTLVAALPMLRRGSGVHLTGLSSAAPGGYAEQVLVEESLAIPVPNGLAPDIAALTEPMAVGLHAVRRGDVAKDTPAVVVGCGPVGLAVISVLKARGVRTVVASDPAAGRRALATACGADIVVDPVWESPYSAVDTGGLLRTLPDGLELLIATMERLRRLPLPWRHALRAADSFGLGPKGPVVFECAGIPGMIDSIIAAAPFLTRLVVVGVCTGADRFRPSMAITKETDIRFAFGYTPLEFRDALHLLADGKINAGSLVTGRVGLDGVGAAFDALGRAGDHAKILVDPRTTGTGISGR
jgi:threonine dehydrogenase-like Zn-dependent dehydrogenase